MAVGADHTCVLSDGKVYCWGKNDHGQLGDGDPISSGAKREFPRPVLLGGSELTGVEKISSSKNHTCALRMGRVYCWGANDHSQLGVAGGDRPEAVAVSGELTGVQEVSAGADHTCAIVNGGIRCWGGNAHGQIGATGASNGTSLPVPITVSLSSNTPVLGASKIAAGDSFTCAIIEGHVKCWGRNGQGQCGRTRAASASEDFAFPDFLSVDLPVQELVAGRSHACMLSNGQILCWGSNENGQLGVLGGVSGTLDSDEPIALQGAQANALQDFQHVYAGGDSTCGLKAGGLWCTGKGSDGQLGNGMAANSFGVVSASSTFSGALLFGIGSGHSCAMTGMGLFCAGKNDSFQLGHQVMPTSSSPGPIKFDAFTPGLQMVATGRDFTCILVKGEVWCTGKNDFHQLGNVDSQYSASALFPIQVQMVDPSQPSVYRPLDRVTAITAGAAHVCAIRDGGLWCWGRVYHPPTIFLASMRRVGAVTLGFQIQDVTYSVATPFSSVATTADSQDVGDLSVGVSAISSSFDHTCAIKRGRLLCWGVNGSGQLGNGTQTSQGLPTRVMQTAALPLMDVSSVSAGKDHTCAIKRGNLLCWGANGSGQLGNGTSVGTTNYAMVSPLLPSNLLLKGVQSVSAGDAHTCAVVNGTAMCWGANGTVQNGTFVSDSRLGGGGTLSGALYPIDALDGVSKVSSIVAGSTFTLAVTSGGVLGFGNNSQGQLGLNSTFSGVSPVLVQNLNEGFGVLQVSAGGAHSCAIAGKQVYCSGSNSFGQLGRRDLVSGTSSTVFEAITASWDPTP
jgi:alpha-tubulin suppressor-like RCC1 family protein